MKIFHLLAFSLLVAFAHAQAPAPEPPGRSPRSTSDRAAELGALERFLSLSDTELAQMADAIARVRAMTPEQRDALKKEISAFRQLPEHQRQQMRRGWGALPPELQEAWREMMQNASPEERAAIQAKMMSLPPPEKAPYRRQVVEEYLRKKEGDGK